MRALEALQRTAVMRRHAAEAHDRAAQLHELLADVVTFDTTVLFEGRPVSDAEREAWAKKPRLPRPRPPSLRPGRG